MVQDSRSSGGSASAFDFSTPGAVMLILKNLRTHTDLDTSVRNEIRDLIFSYTNGSRDEATRQTIEDRLLAVGVTPENIASQNEPSTVVGEVKNEAPKGGFSSGRVAPSFSISFTPSKEAQQSAPIPPEEKPKSPTSAPTPASAPQKTESVAEPDPVPVPKILPTVPTPPTSDVSSQPTDQKQPVPNTEIKPRVPVPGTHDVVKAKSSERETFVEEPILNVATPTPPSPEAPQEETPTIDTTELLERIRIIKADINTKAGNPVNLVSIDNTIGREYMSALLEAMKQLGSGNEATITSAMKRLELAYEQALSVIEMNPVSDTDTKDQIKQSTPATSPKTATPPPPPASTPVPTKDPVAPAPVPSQPATATTSSAPSAVKSVAQAVPIKQPPAPVEETTPISNPPLGVTRPASPTPQKQSTPVPVQSSPKEKREASAPPSSVPIHSSRTTPTKSVAMATPLRKVEELPTLDEVKNRSESGNPLYTGEVSDGLEQLLTEWSIFRKSGVFGTGPRGSGHPLFKKLAPLKIPLIIAGRFEGATEEVRQSITDYMNGWRYEQGIVYEKEETFENYLRRVVRHIVDAQKKK